jgi:hypothetical protein
MTLLLAGGSERRTAAYTDAGFVAAPRLGSGL